MAMTIFGDTNIAMVQLVAMATEAEPSMKGE